MPKLRLHRETLAELTPDELAMVAGAVQEPTPIIRTLPINNCIAVAATIGACITHKLSIQCVSEPPTCYCTPPQ
jgi:hypothetical protein